MLTRAGKTFGRPASRARDNIPLFEKRVWSHAPQASHRRRKIAGRLEEIERWPCSTIIAARRVNTLREARYVSVSPSRA